jgi:hypothetical protein
MVHGSQFMVHGKDSHHSTRAAELILPAEGDSIGGVGMRPVLKPSIMRVLVLLGVWLFMWFGGFGAASTALFGPPLAFGVESPALHTPPAGYQQVGACISGLGRPYRPSNPQSSSPILFYTASGLTTVLYLLDEQPFRDGQSLTLLSELGGLPVTFVSFQHSEQSPFPKENPLSSQLQGPFYQLWITIDLGPLKTRAQC